MITPMPMDVHVHTTNGRHPQHLSIGFALLITYSVHKPALPLAACLPVTRVGCTTRRQEQAHKQMATQLQSGGAHYAIYILL